MIGTFGGAVRAAVPRHRPTTRQHRRRARRGASCVCLRGRDGRRRAAPPCVLERIAYRPLRKRERPPPRRPDLRHRHVAVPAGAGRAAALAGHRSSVAFPRLVVAQDTVFTLLRRRHPQRPGDRDRRRRVVMMVALDQFVSRTRLGRGIRAVVAGPRDRAADGRQHRPGRHAHVPARRHHGRRRRPALRRLPRAHRRSTSASSSASRRSPPPCSAASATSAAPCSAASCSAWSRTTASAIFGHRVEGRRSPSSCSSSCCVPADRPPRRVSSGGRGHDAQSPTCADGAATDPPIRPSRQIGDGGRGLPRWARAAIAASSAIVLACLLPDVTDPRSSTRRRRLGERALLPGRLLRPAGARAQHRRRPGRPARPRLRRLLRHRRLHDRPCSASAHGSRASGLRCRSRSASRPCSPGLLLGAPTLRLRGDYLAIVTLGFGEIVRITAKTRDWLGGPRGISQHPAAAVEHRALHFGVLDAKPYYYLRPDGHRRSSSSWSSALEHSRVGRAWAAIREDEDAAELMGVPTFKFKLWAFAMGAAIGGLSGGCYAGVSDQLDHARHRSPSRSRSCSWPRSCSAARATCPASSSAPSCRLPARALPRASPSTACSVFGAALVS